MKLPDSIRVQGFRVLLVPWTFEEAEENQKWGEFSCDGNLTRICLCVEMEPSQVLNTLLHELLHLIFYTNNIITHRIPDSDESEEFICTVYGNTMAGILIENPHLLKYVNYLSRRASKEL